MKRWWARVSPYWHIITSLAMAFVVGVWWVRDVSGYGGRITTLEEAKTKQEKIITRMDYNIQIIARKVGERPLQGDNE